MVVFGEMQEMGVISRKLFPACGSMCVCCPALRSRSRQPVKRYKKLIADIFPKSPVSMELYSLSLCSFGCVCILFSDSMMLWYDVAIANLFGFSCSCLQKWINDTSIRWAEQSYEQLDYHSSYVTQLNPYRLFYQMTS